VKQYTSEHGRVHPGQSGAAEPAQDDELVAQAKAVANPVPPPQRDFCVTALAASYGV
jgi:hypothetical protein